MTARLDASSAIVDTWRPACRDSNRCSAAAAAAVLVMLTSRDNRIISSPSIRYQSAKRRKVVDYMASNVFLCFKKY
ncbi:hypothetical protein [Burkholderia sp. Bp9140]|uniref:hypothetical protein n=1 Tax=Burkholderia sp. Bp9140 TaxID=2184572 RepID=UPI001629D4A8|nr:hypothetical protein [Burkholderia sp. Bp9140]